MSDVRDPNRDQVAPVPNDNPSCHDLVIEDMKERKEYGLNKYESLLQPFNGRNMLLDVYEELHDAIVYVKGALVEQEGTVTVRIRYCGHSDMHDQHFYDHEGPWFYCDGDPEDEQPTGNQTIHKEPIPTTVLHDRVVATAQIPSTGNGEDWEPLGEDVTTHTMLTVPAHKDGRICSFHQRLGVYVFSDGKRLNLRCLRNVHYSNED